MMRTTIWKVSGGIGRSKKKRFWLLCLQENRCRYRLRYDDEKNNCIYVLEGTSYVYGPYDMLS